MQLTCKPQMLMVIFKKNVKWQKFFHQFSMITNLLLTSKKKEKVLILFAKLFSLQDNGSTIPLHAPSKNTSNVHFTSDDIRKMIRKLKSIKPQSHDMVRTRVLSHGMVSTGVLRVYDKSICKPLELIFKAFFQVNEFFHLN